MILSGITIKGASLGMNTAFNIIEGGTVTYYQNYTIHTFTANSTITVKSLGTTSNTIQLYMVGGGGGGGGWFSGGIAGGGGGGGGMFYNSNVRIPVGQHNIVVGAGGNGYRYDSANGIHTPSGRGGDTTLLGMTALGGGKGGPGSLNPLVASSNTYYYQEETSGGNGGGAVSGRFNTNNSYLPGRGLQDFYPQSQPNEMDGQGSGYGSHAGGGGYHTNDNLNRAGGGGGAQGINSDIVAGGTNAYYDAGLLHGGNGGFTYKAVNPIAGSTHGIFIDGFGYSLGGGGGGGAGDATTHRRGLGSSGGGDGALGLTVASYIGPTNAIANYGAGGGGGVSPTTLISNPIGGNGSAGVVIIRYRNS